jgi:hypothetical protein
MTACPRQQQEKSSRKIRSQAGVGSIPIDPVAGALKNFVRYFYAIPCKFCYSCKDPIQSLYILFPVIVPERPLQAGRNDIIALEGWRHTMRTKGTVVAAALIAVMMAMPVMAEEKKTEPAKADRPGGVIVEAVSISATVDAIDSKTRTITLKGSDGSKTSFIAGDEVRNFAQIKVGDIVTYDLVEAVALDVQKSTEAPKMVETESMKRAKLGEKPSGSIETVGFLTVRVEEIDYKTRKVAIKTPEGKIVHFTAGDQVKRLNEVKKGDEVVMQYMQKISIKVTTPAAPAAK